MKLFKQKIASNDFDVNSLPKNRREQFFDIIKHRYRLLLLLGLFILLFSIPSLLFSLVKGSVLKALEMDTSLIEEEKILISYITYIAYYFLECIGFLVISIGLAGVFKILKELAYGEPIFFKDDFKNGIKENFKSFFILALIFDFFYLCQELILLFFGGPFLRYLPYAFNLVIIFPSLIIGLFLSSVYKNKITQIISVSYTLYIKKMPFIFVIFCLMFSFVLFKYINIYMIMSILEICFIIFLLPLIIMMFTQYSYSVADELINKEQFPDYYLKGLFVKK